MEEITLGEFVAYCKARGLDITESRLKFWNLMLYIFNLGVRYALGKLK
jgi:hypothetical protein